MVALQQRLDDDRAAFRKFYTEMPKIWTTRSARHAAKNLIELDQYRRLPFGWGESDPIAWGKFQKLQASEEELRQEFISHLDKIAKTAGSTGNMSAERLSEERKRFESIKVQEKNLYRVRREWGRQFINDAKSVFDIGAGNQVSDIARSGGQSADLLRRYVRNPDLEKGHPSDRAVFIGQMAAVAAHFRAGACSEQSAWVATEAYKLMAGTQVTMVADDRVDHMYTVLGPPNFLESAYVDSWPAMPSVANVATYGLKNKPENWTYFQGVADGRDLRAEGAKWLHPLPKLPSPKPPLSFEQATAYLHGRDAKAVYYITSTKEGYNSDSDTEVLPKQGLTLSDDAFTANATNNFRTKNMSMEQIASMRSDFHAGPSVTSKYPTRAVGNSKKSTEQSRRRITPR
ncbi:hypothetical protein AB0F46_41945 [Streptomyces sp. NPDC026665]|uniref:hypothetical protein n=1 Tax=Streptomyces sp. NPDC026665 TaxID=3154798 RepID=UPI003411171D